MCFQFRPPDPLPETPTGMDALVDDLLGFASAWAGLHLVGKLTVTEARARWCATKPRSFTRSAA
jgi:hypothetical protein